MRRVMLLWSKFIKYGSLKCSTQQQVIVLKIRMKEEKINKQTAIFFPVFLHL